MTAPKIGVKPRAAARLTEPPSVSSGGLSALLGYVYACEQTLLAEQLPVAERSDVGSPQRWNARAILAHNADFRREQVIRLRHVADGTEPPGFPRLDHRDPEVYRGYLDRGWQILVRGAWHPIGHVSDYLVAHDRAEQAADTVEGVLRAARALQIPAAPGGTAMAVYVLACVRAQAGDRDAALTLLRAALADDPALAANAARDPDLAALRSDPDFPVLATT
jgi:hypothetical protein